MKKILKITVYVFATIGFILTGGFFAVKFGITDTTGIIDNQREGFYETKDNDEKDKNLVWNQSEGWQVFKEAIIKDLAVLKRVEGETGVNARTILSVLAVEQLRLFNSERETFKTLFAPLKILGTQSQFSWGVTGIKPETAKQIEKNLKDTSSPYYLGKEFENYLNFKTRDPDNERFTRMTDYKDRYFSYLYSALYIKEVTSAWKKSGFSIDQNIGVIATLFNIGFENSKPNPDPKIGGAEIEIDGKIYSFGGLAKEFYESEELIEYFPREN
jgi:hypothetical protein